MFHRWTIRAAASREFGRLAVKENAANSKNNTRSMPSSSRSFTNTLLFLSSFAPLFFALACRFEGTALRTTCVVLALIGTLALLGILFLWLDRTPMTVVIASADDRGPDVSGYVTAYLLPLLVVPQPTIDDLIAYILILGVIGLIYVRSNMMQMNPLLYVIGLRLHAVTTHDGFRGYLIGAETPRIGDTLRVARRNNILLTLRS
jgi:hypothetical protein